MNEIFSEISVHLNLNAANKAKFKEGIQQIIDPFWCIKTTTGQKWTWGYHLLRNQPA